MKLQSCKEGFVKMPNAVVRDAAISKTALKLLGEMLSYSNEYEIQPKNFVQEGRKLRTVQVAFAELEAQGFLCKVHYIPAGQNSRGKRKSEYVVSDCPRSADEFIAAIRTLPRLQGARILTVNGQGVPNEKSESKTEEAIRLVQAPEPPPASVVEVAPEPEPEPVPTKGPVMRVARSADGKQFRNYLDFSNPDYRIERRPSWQVELNQQVEPKLRGDIAREIAKIHGRDPFYDRGDEVIMETMHRFAVLLHSLGFTTVESVAELGQEWRATTTKGKRGEYPYLLSHRLADSDFAVFAAAKKSEGRKERESEQRSEQRIGKNPARFIPNAIKRQDTQRLFDKIIVSV